MKRYERKPQILKTTATPDGPPSFLQLRILGTGANGSPSAAALQAGNQFYLFNCGEGFQRLASIHKVKLTRMNPIFLTRNSWDMTGGIMGTALTQQDSGVQQLAIYGPTASIQSIFHCLRDIVILENLHVDFVDSATTREFKDLALSVLAVPMLGGNDKQTYVSYICQLQPKPRKLNSMKLAEVGPLSAANCAALRDGKSVKFTSGRVVQPADVLDVPEIPICCLIADLPPHELSTNLATLAATFTDTSSVTAVVHFTEPHICAQTAYKDFMKHYFPATTQHIYLHSEENRFSGFAAAHEIQYKLNYLQPQIFPLLDEASQSGHSKRDVNSCTLSLRPRRAGLQGPEVELLAPHSYLQELFTLPNFTQLYTELRQNYPLDLKRTPDYPCLSFLGTGSTLPSKRRNTSGILVQTAPAAYVLLDCGEGTYGQMVRLFGASKTEEILRQLRVLFISHEHPDHNIGLLDVLRARASLNLTDALKLMLPKQLMPWLAHYDAHIESLQHTYEIIDNASLITQPLRPEAAHGIAEISTCEVLHVVPSYGISLRMFEQDKHGKPIKLTYSGDTMPCPQLIELGKDSTVLIHEATMEDELHELAKLNTHSTISQAIEQRRAMNAQFLILTHFSQRYSKFPVLPEPPVDAAGKPHYLKNVALAFDNMQVKLSDLEYYHFLYPTFAALFAENTRQLRKIIERRKRRTEGTTHHS